MMRLRTVVAVLVIACAAPGCSRRRSNSTLVNDGSDIFTTDSFPGAPVQDHNVADDQRAMSNSGDTAFGLRVFVNGSRGQVIAVYSDLDGHIYAHHYDGETWTPPVSLSALDYVPLFN